MSSRLEPRFLPYTSRPLAQSTSPSALSREDLVQDDDNVEDDEGCCCVSGKNKDWVVGTGQRESKKAPRETTSPSNGTVGFLPTQFPLILGSPPFYPSPLGAPFLPPSFLPLSFPASSSLSGTSPHLHPFRRYSRRISVRTLLMSPIALFLMLTPPSVLPPYPASYVCSAPKPELAAADPRVDHPTVETRSGAGRMVSGSNGIVKWATKDAQMSACHSILQTTGRTLGEEALLVQDRYRICEQERNVEEPKDSEEHHGKGCGVLSLLL